MSFRQEAGDGEGNVCNQVDIYCSATNRFLNLFIFGETTDPIFATSWTRAPELLTAKSALACVQVPTAQGRHFLRRHGLWTFASDYE